MNEMIELYKNLKNGGNYTSEEAETLVNELRPFYEMVYRCLKLGIVSYEFYNKFILSPNQLFIRLIRQN